MKIKIITSFGTEKTVTIADEQICVLSRGNGNDKKVLSHESILSLAKEGGFSVGDIICDLAMRSSKNNFHFVYRARYTDVQGITTEEVGEATPENCETSISMAYPALVAHKRAVDRLFVNLLGLKEEFYSDTEISVAGLNSLPTYDASVSSVPSGTSSEEYSAVQVDDDGVIVENAFTEPETTQAEVVIETSANESNEESDESDEGADVSTAEPESETEEPCDEMQTLMNEIEKATSVPMEMSFYKGKGLTINDLLGPSKKCLDVIMEAKGLSKEEARKKAKADLLWTIEKFNVTPNTKPAMLAIVNAVKLLRENEFL